KAIADRQSQLEASNERIEREVLERTRELKTSEERFRLLNASSPVGVFQADATGQCVYVNESWQTTAGLTFEKSQGRGWIQALHPEESGMVLQEMSISMSLGREFSREFRLLTPAGETRWVQFRSKPMFAEDGSLIGHVGTVADITERMLAEA